MTQIRSDMKAFQSALTQELIEIESQGVTQFDRLKKMLRSDQVVFQ